MVVLKSSFSGISVVKLFFYRNCLTANLLASNEYGQNQLYVFIMSYRSLEWIFTLRLPECRGTPCSKQMWYLNINETQTNNHLVYAQTFIHFSHFGQLAKWLCVLVRTSDCGFESRFGHYKKLFKRKKITAMIFAWNHTMKKGFLYTSYLSINNIL